LKTPLNELEQSFLAQAAWLSISLELTSHFSGN